MQKPTEKCFDLREESADLGIDAVNKIEEVLKEVKNEKKAFYKIIFVKWINHKKNIALVYFPDYSLEILITLFVSIEIYSNKIYKVKYIINDSNLLEFIY